MLAQSAYFGFRIGEISCPTKYFPEASSINFRRSVRLQPPARRQRAFGMTFAMCSRWRPSAGSWPVAWPGWWCLASSQRGSRPKGQPVPRQGCFEFSAVSVHRNCHLRGFADFRCGERHIAGIAAGRGSRRDLGAGAWLPPGRDQRYGGCRPCVFSQQIPVPPYGRASGGPPPAVAQARFPDCSGWLETGVHAADLANHAVRRYQLHAWPVLDRPARLCRGHARVVAGPVWLCVYRTLADAGLRLDYWCRSGSLDAARRWRPYHVGSYHLLRADRHEAVARIASGGGAGAAGRSWAGADSLRANRSPGFAMPVVVICFLAAVALQWLGR